MSTAIYELAILLSLKDAASNRLDSFGEKLRARGKDARHALEEYESLRKSIGQDIAIGGVGLATLAMFKRGVEQAGDFQSSITELRLAIEEAGKDGSVNLAKLNDQMARFSHLGMTLGNQLPGTTKDFTDMFIALKQGGMPTETILGGAGEAVAHLAVLTGSNPAELAKQYAQLGEQFQLKPEEYTPSAEVFLKNYRAVGLRPEDLIEGTKFAQLRGGLPLGLSGLTGMQTMSNMLAMLKMMGLEGGIGGREVAGLLMHLSPTSKEQKKADAELRKKGIDLQFFDKKGSFLGTENAIQQFAKLKKLSAEERMDIGKKRFGSAEALGPVTVFAEQGEEGYAKLKARMDAVVPMQDELNEKLSNYNQKMEALSGTLDNLKVSVFTPMLEPLSKASDKANIFVGNLQGFTETNPTITKTVLLVGSIGGASLTAYAGLKLLVTGWKLWRIASAIGASETGLVSFLTRTQTQAAATGTAMKVAAVETAAAKAVMSEQMQLPWADNMRGKGPVQPGLPFLTSATTASNNLGRSIEETTVKATGLRAKFSTPIRATVQFATTGYGQIRSAINNIPMSVQVAVTMMVTQWTIDKLEEWWATRQEYDEAKKHLANANAGNLQTIAKAREEFAKLGQPVPQEIWKGQANAALNSIDIDNELKAALGGWTAGAWLHHMNPFAPGNPYGSQVGARFNVGWGAQMFKERAPELREPEIMAEMRKMIDSWKLPTDQREKVDKALQAAFPESFAKASQMAAEDMTKVSAAAQQSIAEWQKMYDPLRLLTDGMGHLNSQTTPLAESFRGAQSSAVQLPPALDNAGSAAESFANRMNGLQFSGPRLLTPQYTGPQGSPTPQSAVGSVVERSGIVNLHRGNVIFPAHLSRRRPGDWLDAMSALGPRIREGAPSLGHTPPEPAPANPRVTQREVYGEPLISKDSGDRISDFSSLRQFNARIAGVDKFVPSSPFASVSHGKQSFQIGRIVSTERILDDRLGVTRRRTLATVEPRQVSPHLVARAEGALRSLRQSVPVSDDAGGAVNIEKLELHLHGVEGSDDPEEWARRFASEFHKQLEQPRSKRRIKRIAYDDWRDGEERA
jgi:TP901 family phage tail tape measure protein